MSRYIKYSHEKLAEEKTRMPDTRQGLVPLRRGKYGMDVEEYLEWVQEREQQYKVRPPNETSANNNH